MDLREPRRVAWGVLAAATVAFVVAAVVLVPWDTGAGVVTPVSPGELFTPEQIARAEHHARWARVWSWSSLAVSLAVLAWLALGRRGRRLFSRLPGPWSVQVVLAVALCQAAVLVATLPMRLARVELARRTGLTDQAWSGVARDLAVGVATGVVLTGLVVLVVVGATRRFPRTWPGWVALAGVLLVAAGSWLYPVAIEPLFNRFEPLQAGPLRDGVLVVARDEGVEVDDVLVADASRRTTTLNAYVSGLGSTRRVVLYDTLVRDMPTDQALAVVAHEVAHAREHDVASGTLLGALGVAAGAGVLGLVLTQPRVVGRWDPRQAAVVPLLLALAAVGGQVVSPVESGISRRVEERADVVALRVTEDPAAFEAMQVALALRAASDPTPPALSQWWWGSHPTVLRRVAVARSFDERR